MLTGFILGTISMACIMKSGVFLLLLLYVFVFFASREYVKILEHKGFYPSLKVIWLAEAVFGLIAYFQRYDLTALALSVFSIVAFMWVLFRGRQPYIANAATTVLGFIYCGWFPLHLIFLRELSSQRFHDGLGFVVMMFTAILLTDIGCYYAGRHLGKHKLAPVVSPNKTVEIDAGGKKLCVTQYNMGDQSEFPLTGVSVVSTGNYCNGNIFNVADRYISAIKFYFCKNWNYEKVDTRVYCGHDGRVLFQEYRL